MVSSVTGKTAIVLPENWNEIHVVIAYDSGGIRMAYNHLYEEAYDTEYRYQYGVGGGNSGNPYMRYMLSKTSFALNVMYSNSDVSENTTVSVWYR